MESTVHLCKIGELVTDMDEFVFKTKDKLWKAFGILEKNEASKIVDISTYQRSGFYLLEFESSLYLSFKTQFNQQNTAIAQSQILPLIFENFILDEDLSLRMAAENHDNEPIKLIKKQAANKLYDALLLAHQTLNPNPKYNYEIEKPLDLPVCFLPTLPKFQERTVKWLIEREVSPGRIESYFKRFQAKDGITSVYKNVLCSELRTEKPQEIELPPGGILADEMGLGKTVEILALMLINKRSDLSFEQPITQNDEDEIPLKKRRVTTDEVLCICTQQAKKGQLLNCSLCRLWQHKRCVSKYADNSTYVRDSYICPPCWKNFTETCLIKSGATLIVTPSTIRKQWLREINRHINSTTFRVFEYNGISDGWISPIELAKNDVILTDYNVLRREVFHTSAQDSDRSMRKQRRTLRLYTPLLMIDFWRIILDEAQMVESDASRIASLVRMLSAVNRWAVSGTPIQRSIDDLYPLVRFIGLEDYLNFSMWKTLVKDFMMYFDKDDKKYKKSLLVEILRQIMWRTGKLQVQDELPIPPQTEKIHRICLSDLEQFFYTQQHEECELNFNEILNKYIECTDSIVSTSHQIMKTIMKPLLKIRQCCSIPTVITSSHKQTSAGVVQKQFLQPKELHLHLLTKTEKECKGHLRSFCSAYNGLAAIHFIKGDYSNAVENYEAVLKLAKEYSSQKNISVDSLLQIHALYNILQAKSLSQKFATSRTSEVFEKYELNLNELEWKYLETYASQLKVVNENFIRAQEILHTNSSNLNMNLLDFLCVLLEIDDNNIQTQLLAKILDECIRKFGSMRLEAASSLRGVLYIIATWYEKLEKEQKKIEKAFKELEYFTLNIRPRSQVSVQTWRDVSGFINSVCDCHLMELRELEIDGDKDLENKESSANINRSRHKRVGKNVCKLCQLINNLNQYECLLFKKSIDLNTNIGRGDENPQLEFEMIRIIFSFLKPKRPALSTEIEKHFKTLQNMQNFCKKAIKFWIEIEFTVKAYDELDMCKMRVTLTDDPSERNNYKIMLHELDLTYIRQEQSLKYAQNLFKIKFARLRFIKHLEVNSEVGPCPICQSEEERRHTFLICGHQICWSCFKFLRRLSHGTKLTCSICRNEQHIENVYFVTSTNKNSPTQDIPIQGDFSSKLTYIVQLIKKLQRENKTPAESILDANEVHPLKILIFSQWQAILNALANALKENKINFIQHTHARTIEQFKNEDITCLLMPISKGCKGLNLIEATHVFLMEPVLNPSEELQAIGRVHRFGQTKSTTVHRFITNKTVEENIYKVVSAGRGTSHFEFDSMTFENLRDLFRLRKNLVTELNDEEGSDAVFVS